MRKAKKIRSIAVIATIILLLFLGLFAFNQTIKWGVKASNLPAFPGAQGFGSTTPGGRGGRAIFVTNLSDYSSNEARVEGSLRSAIETSGPRIVIFKTGGIIKLKRPLIITEPYITLAGQTAPGDGITIRDAPLTVATHDVIIRNIRSRVGDDKGGTTPENRDGVSVSGTKTKGSVYNVVIDHSSISWAIDENFSTWTNKVRDVTFQWNIVSEGLYCNLHQEAGATSPDCHSMGLLIGDHSKNISIHHNLLAHNADRNPLIQANTSTEFINNIVYNWGAGSYPIKFSDSNRINRPVIGSVINNYFKRGPNSTTVSRVGVLLNDNLETGSRIYVDGNIFYNKDGSKLYSDNILGSTNFRISGPPISSGITVSEGDSDLVRIVSQVGAIAPKRDLVDQNVVKSFSDGGGNIIDCIISCDAKDIRSTIGWPPHSIGSASKDTDSDGIPDEWESARGLNPTSSVDANQFSPQDYTWIEEYINSLIPSTVTFTPTRTPTPTTSNSPLEANPTTLQNEPATKTIVTTIKTGLDDVNQDESGFQPSSKSLWLGNGVGPSYTGLRFANPNLPRNSKIKSAKIELFTKETARIILKFHLQAETSDNSQTYSAHNPPSTRTLTSSKVLHQSNTQTEEGIWFSIFDLTPIIQELVNRPGWTQDSPLNLILKGETTDFARKFFTSFEKDPSLAPKLTITFE